MNMHRASRRGWVRSLREASCHASKELSDPAQLGLATATCRSGSADAERSRSRSATHDLAVGSSHLRARAGVLRRFAPGLAPGAHTLHWPRCDKRRGGALLLAAVALLLTPAFAFADVPTASVAGPENVVEPATNVAIANAEFIVTLTGGTGSADVEIDYTVTGTATKDVDYTEPDGTLTIEDGSYTGTISISIKFDEVDEQGETLVVTLTEARTTAGAATVGTPDQATTTINSADTVTVSVAADSNLPVVEGVRSVGEGAQDGAAFTVSLSSDQRVAQTVVAYAVSPGSATTADYTATSASGTLTIAVGDTDGEEFTVQTVNDKLAEDDETFTVKLTLVEAPDNVALGTSTATVRIDDDDDLTASVTMEEETVEEGSVATFTVALTYRTAASERRFGSADVVVEYTTTTVPTDVTNPAKAMDDYEEPSGTLTIVAGEATGKITIQTLEDDVLEPTEGLTVTLTDVSTVAGEVELPVATDQDREAQVTIMVGDTGTVTASVADTAVDEGELALFTVTLSGKVSEDVKLGYQTSTATIPPDFAATTTGRLTIAAGETTGTITINTVEDRLAEGDEAFTARLEELTANDDALPTGVELGDLTATGDHCRRRSPDGVRSRPGNRA